MPRAAEHHHKPEDHCSKDHAREEQPLDAVLDRVENHKDEQEREDEQQHGTQKRMPQPGVD